MVSAYKVPPGGLYAADPRTVNDIILRSLAIHGFSIFAYAQFIDTLSWDTQLMTYILQMAMFMLFPEFILVQLCYCIVMKSLPNPSRISQYVPLSMLNESGKALKASANGSPCQQDLTENFKQREVSWYLQLAVLILDIVPLTYTIFAYHERLGIIFMKADYVANLYVDHRNGWSAIGGLVAACLSTVLIISKRIFAGREGTRSPYSATFRVEEASKLVLFAMIVITTLIHQILLAATNHIVPLYSLRWAILACLMSGAIVAWRRPQLRSIIKVACVWCVLFLIFFIAVSQFGSDVMELIQVSHNLVQPYNYRWRVKDMISTKTKVEYLVSKKSRHY